MGESTVRNGNRNASSSHLRLRQGRDDFSYNELEVQKKIGKPRSNDIQCWFLPNSARFWIAGVYRSIPSLHIEETIEFRLHCRETKILWHRESEFLIRVSKGKVIAQEGFQKSSNIAFSASWIVLPIVICVTFCLVVIKSTMRNSGKSKTRP